MRYTHVLFDLDGTLSNSSNGVIDCFYHALDALNIKRPDYQELRKTIIGPPIADSFAHFGVAKAEINHAIDIFRKKYNVTGWCDNIPYDGIEDMLKALHEAGVHLFVATSKPEPSALRIIEYFNFTKYFDCIAGADLKRSNESKDEVLDAVFMQIKGVDKEKVLMVGDRKYDMIGAQNHSIDCAAVLFGFGERAELSAYPHVLLAETPNDITRLVLGEK